MIVVDANIIAYLLINGDRTAEARQLHEREPEWIVPPLWQHEFLNVLATLVKQGGGTVADALEIWQLAQIHLVDREESVAMSEALKLATSAGISAYDAQYLTLASALGCVLVTEDKRLVQKFPDSAVTMQTYLHRMNGMS
ncbi:MAG: type II toxin-antitoxin system VapC family toxin [Anaerolinea sp.]|nr:type II toxin-antitoxin system VapC family toxin [Anaerolinea sp.]